MVEINITLLDGTVLKTSVESFSSEEIARKINAQDAVVVAIGEEVVNRHNIKTVTKAG